VILSSLHKIEVSIGKWIAFPLAHLYKMIRGQLRVKAYGTKVLCYWEHLEEHKWSLRNLMRTN
jgi:hypothetical protein